MKKLNYRTPDVKVVTVAITHQVCQNSIGGLELTDGSTLNPGYDPVTGDENDL